MTGLQQARGSSGRENRLEMVQNLLGKILLDLQPARHRIDESSQRGESSQMRARQVGHRRRSLERKKMVPAYRHESDSPDDDQGIGRILGERNQEPLPLFAVPGKKLPGPGFRDLARSLP
jgi:hypothetical protein